MSSAEGTSQSQYQAIKNGENEAGRVLEDSDRTARALATVDRLFPERAHGDNRMLFSEVPDTEPELRQTDFIDATPELLRKVNNSCVVDGEDFLTSQASDYTVWQPTDEEYELGEYPEYHDDELDDVDTNYEGDCSENNLSVQPIESFRLHALRALGRFTTREFRQ